MIEVIHFQNRYGKTMVGVIGVKETTPAGYEYAQRYAAGLEEPFYPVPACYSPDTLFAVYYALAIIKDIWR
jgi:hypothetical protein